MSKYGDTKGDSRKHVSLLALESELPKACREHPAQAPFEVWAKFFVETVGPAFSQ